MTYKKRRLVVGRLRLVGDTFYVGKLQAGYVTSEKPLRYGNGITSTLDWHCIITNSGGPAKTRDCAISLCRGAIMDALNEMCPATRKEGGKG